MNIGIIGTGAIARKHALAYRNIGDRVTACTNRTAARGQQFAAETGADFVSSPEALAQRDDVDILDVCTFPAYRLAAVELAARYGKHVLVQKPMALDTATARAMIDTARKAGIQLGVVSQHRCDDATLFLKKAIADGRLGRLLQADAYVKWYRAPDYYVRPGKGRWEVEGGGALINQGIHAVDLLLHLAGPVNEVFADGLKPVLHPIESDDHLNALLRFRSGARGVLQVSTALWPGAPERLELHGTEGSAIVTGDQLSLWQVREDHGDPAPVRTPSGSGATDPLAIATLPFERQLRDFGEACRQGRAPACSGIEGYRALELVRALYQSCAEACPIPVENLF